MKGKIEIADIVALIDQYAEQEETSVHEVFNTLNRYDQITQLNVNNRARNALANADITCFDDLLDCSPYDLTRIPNIGAETYTKICDALWDFGYRIESWNGFNHIPIRYHLVDLPIYRSVSVNYHNSYEHCPWVKPNGFKYCYGLSKRFIKNSKK